jgi:hypothetical protein
MSNRLALVVKRHEEPYQVERYQGAPIVDTVRTPSWAPAETLNLSILPVGRLTINAFPDGSVKAGDIIIHDTSHQDVKEKDHVTYEGSLYEIRENVSRPRSNFSIYVGRRLNDSNTEPIK